MFSGYLMHFSKASILSKNYNKNIFCFFLKHTTFFGNTWRTTLVKKKVLEWYVLPPNFFFVCRSLPIKRNCIFCKCGNNLLALEFSKKLCVSLQLIRREFKRVKDTKREIEKERKIEWNKEGERKDNEGEVGRRERE